MPTRRLPSRPDLEHLKHQARDLLAAHRARSAEAQQRISEFHPRFGTSSNAVIDAPQLALSDALLVIAREYGFPSWTRLKAHVERPERANFELAHHERIEDAGFRRAVELLDAGDTDGLHDHLAGHPNVVHQRVSFEGGNYFRNPTLLEFSAENPVRHGTLPPNIVDVARVILDAGAKADRRGVEETLGLVASGRVARECGAQVPLIDLLCDYGADPACAMVPALAHAEFDAAEALILRGAPIDLTAAAALGWTNEARRLLPDADGESRHRALALAAQHGRVDIVRILLDAGEDPNRYNPVGLHSHSTPLHQAATSGHEDVVRLLVQRGADTTMQDTVFRGTPLAWAEHAGHTNIAAYLRSG